MVWVLEDSSAFLLSTSSPDWSWFCLLCYRRTHTSAVMNVMLPALTCLTLHSWWETESGEVSSPTGNRSHGPGILSHCWPTSLCHGTKVWSWLMTSRWPLSMADQLAWCWRNPWTKVKNGNHLFLSKLSFNINLWAIINWKSNERSGVSKRTNPETLKQVIWRLLLGIKAKK